MIIDTDFERRKVAPLKKKKTLLPRRRGLAVIRTFTFIDGFHVTSSLSKI